jgi:hypothetical protein
MKVKDDRPFRVFVTATALLAGASNLTLAEQSAPIMMYHAAAFMPDVMDIPRPARITQRQHFPERRESVSLLSQDLELKATFDRLAKQWKEQTSGYSSVGTMVMHPAYLQIISHGEKMIPFILKDLEAKPSHWFIALKILAKNFSPVRPEDAGNIKKMTEAWLAWGKANGKLG